MRHNKGRNEKEKRKGGEKPEDITKQKERKTMRGKTLKEKREKKGKSLGRGQGYSEPESGEMREERVGWRQAETVTQREGTAKPGTDRQR